MAHEGFRNERRIAPRRNNDRAVTHRSANLIDVQGMSVSWGGVWGGVLIGVGLLFLLTALGLALGVTAADPNSDNSSLGMGAAVWAGISLLLALYIAGMASTRIGAIFDKTTGMFEGTLVWVLSLLVIVYLAGSGIGLVAGGAFKLIGGATQTIGSMVTGSTPDISQGTIDQVMQRLRDPQSSRVIAAATGMPQDQVRSNLTQIADKAEAAKDNPAQAAADVRQSLEDISQRARADGTFARAADKAKAAATKTAWITFGALLLSLLAAVFGSMTGRRAAAVTAGRE
jgi:hypothetical protein